MELGSLGGLFDSAIGLSEPLGLTYTSGLMPTTVSNDVGTYKGGIYGYVGYKDEIHFFGQSDNMCGTFNINTGQMRYIVTPSPWSSTFTMCLQDGNFDNPKLLRMRYTDATGVNLAYWYDAEARTHTVSKMSNAAMEKTVYGTHDIFTFRDVEGSSDNHEIYKFDPEAETNTFVGKYSGTNDNYTWAVCHVGGNKFYLFRTEQRVKESTMVYEFDGNTGNMVKVADAATTVATYPGDLGYNIHKIRFYGYARCYFNGNDKIYMCHTARNDAKLAIWSYYDINEKHFKTLVNMEEHVPSGQNRTFSNAMIAPGMVSSLRLQYSPIALSLTKFSDPTLTDCYRG